MRTLEKNLNLIISILVIFLIVLSFFVLNNLIHQPHRLTASIGIITGIISLIGVKLINFFEKYLKNYRKNES